MVGAPTTWSPQHVLKMMTCSECQLPCRGYHYDVVNHVVGVTMSWISLWCRQQCGGWVLLTISWVSLWCCGWVNHIVGVTYHVRVSTTWSPRHVLTMTTCSVYNNDISNERYNYFDYDIFKHPLDVVDFHPTYYSSQTPGTCTLAQLRSCNFNPVSLSITIGGSRCDTTSPVMGRCPRRCCSHVSTQSPCSTL